MADHPEWQERLLSVYDRSLSRAYPMDPLLYAELLKARRRLAGQFERQSAPSNVTHHRHAA
jgi:hypothetical protein